MKKYLFTFVLMLAVFSNLNAQEIAVENTVQNVLTVGIDNEIILLVENIPSSQIRLKLDNGFIKESELRNHFIIVPMNIGKTILQIFKKNNGKLILIGSRTYRTHYPMLNVKLGKSTKQIHISELEKCNQISLFVPNLDWNPEPTFNIVRFKLEFIFQGKIQNISLENTSKKFQ